MPDVGGVMKELESLGTEQFRNTYLRHGANEPLYGVSFANLKMIARRVKRDHELALELWASGNSDARSLATMLVDPALIDSKTADAWVSSTTYYMLVDLAANVVARSPIAHAKGDEWRVSDNEWVGQAGWDIIAYQASNDPKVPDSYFAARLDEIEKHIKGAKNRVRHAMNAALISIGGARPGLRPRALALARSIGKVVVDHGETGCVTPDATIYIGIMAQRAAASAPAAEEPPAPVAEEKPAKAAAKKPAKAAPAAKPAKAAPAPKKPAPAPKKPAPAAKKPAPAKKPAAKPAAKKKR
jgi:3-methyladenine DNA glycosylase AlkD